MTGIILHHKQVNLELSKQVVITCYETLLIWKFLIINLPKSDIIHDHGRFWKPVLHNIMSEITSVTSRAGLEMCNKRKGETAQFQNSIWHSKVVVDITLHLKSSRIVMLVVIQHNNK